MKITKRHYNAALSLANRARKNLGKKPVTRLRKGIPGNADSCPVARTVGDGVTVDYPIIFGGCRGTVYADEGMENVLVEGSYLSGDFLKAFDAGEIPELIAS